MANILRVAIVGDPSGGKTTGKSISKLSFTHKFHSSPFLILIYFSNPMKNFFERLDFQVFASPEIVSIFLLGGVKFENLGAEQKLLFQ